MVMRPFQTYYWWVYATFYDTKSSRSKSAFSGYWLSEQEANQWAIGHYATLPGSEYKVIKSTSRDRNVARNQLRHDMVESGEQGSVVDVLNIRFQDQNKNDG